MIWLVLLLQRLRMSAKELPRRLIRVDGTEEAEALLHFGLERVMEEHRVVRGVGDGEAHPSPEVLHVIGKVLSDDLLPLPKLPPNPQPRFALEGVRGPIVAVAP